MNIFLSYGHDGYDKFAYRLKQDLEAQGFKVWIDVEKISESTDWEQEIERGITNSDWFIIMMTQHSCRRPDGVCLDEVSYARFLGKKIAPIMVENVKPPLCIARIQYIDMENHYVPGAIGFDEKSYQHNFKKLLAILQGLEKCSIEGEFDLLNNRLKPLDNDVYIERYQRNYSGRLKLFDYIDHWIQNDTHFLWIIGDAGVGKTAFVAQLATKSNQVKAVHFCKYNDSDRADAKRAIMAISYYLATQNQPYRTEIISLDELDRLQEKSTERLFSYLLLEPLSKIPIDQETAVIIIDALDEATQDGKNELANILASNCEFLPKWVKIIVTSRDEPILRRILSAYSPIAFEDKSFVDNDEDIKDYLYKSLAHMLSTNTTTAIDQLVKYSAGSFLYARTITDDITSGRISIDSIDSFPTGLTGIYTSFFNRLISETQCDYKYTIRPLMEVLCAEYSPLPSENIFAILKYDEYDFEDIKESIAQMFPERRGIIEPVHKSIVDWLSDKNRSGQYHVSIKKGHEKLANYCLESHKYGHETEYVFKYTIKHLLRSNMSEDAAKLLAEQAFQEARIQLIGLDSAIRAYLSEIKELVSSENIRTNAIFSTSTFLYYFTTYRKFLYNTALFFELRDSRFDSTVSIVEKAGTPATRVGIAQYYYITERFNITESYVLRLLENEQEYQQEELIELYNVLALCFRKKVVFDTAKEYFSKAFSCSQAHSYDYDRSISAINLGKIAYHELNWDAAKVWNKLALELLQNAFEASISDDAKTSIRLFIAEYHRLIAECVIWNDEHDNACFHLDQAAKIYESVAARDRYYTRYIYTKALTEITHGNPLRGLSYCHKAMQMATSKYDQSQILFYQAIAYLQLDVQEKALQYATNSLTLANEIGAWLECEEITIILNIITDRNQHTDKYYTNRFIENWSEYAEKHILNLLSRSTEKL